MLRGASTLLKGWHWALGDGVETEMGEKEEGGREGGRDETDGRERG